MEDRKQRKLMRSRSQDGIVYIDGSKVKVFYNATAIIDLDDLPFGTRFSNTEAFETSFGKFIFPF